MNMSYTTWLAKVNSAIRALTDDAIQDTTDLPDIPFGDYSDLYEAYEGEETPLQTARALLDACGYRC